MIISKKRVDAIDVLLGENDSIRFEIAPALGGKILSIYNKHLKKEFLWNNKNLFLKMNKPGADYDSNFWGGIDELIPNDIPENIDSISYPDHGELWTTVLDYNTSSDQVSVFGKMPLCELHYHKAISLDADLPQIRIDYKIKNESKKRRHFLWKLHAALIIKKGDRLHTSAQKAKIVYPEASRFKRTEEFKWPMIENVDASLVPARNNTMDFFYLYDIEGAEMRMISGQSKHSFAYRYDKAVFPYQWYFASNGAFLNHYTSILEPATAMPVSVNEAMELGQCSVLESGQGINTTVHIYAGETN